MFGVPPAKPISPLGTLSLCGMVFVPQAHAKFVAAQKFVVDSSESSVVKITELHPDFVKEFLGKVEDVVPSRNISIYKAKSQDLEVSAAYNIWPVVELGGEDKAEIRLAEMYYVLERQGRGEEGHLHINGPANMFLIRNIGGVLRKVCADCRNTSWRIGPPMSPDTPLSWVDAEKICSPGRAHVVV